MEYMMKDEEENVDMDELNKKEHEESEEIDDESDDEPDSELDDEEKEVKN